MISFGLITEGLTDQIVIEDILSGYFNTDDIIVNPLRQYCKNKVLINFYQDNPSLKIFIQEIEKRDISIEDDG